MTISKDQNTIRQQREHLIKNLKDLYQNSFVRISNLNLPERKLAKLTQILLLSQEGAISPLQKEIEAPLITKAPNDR